MKYKSAHLELPFKLAISNFFELPNILRMKPDGAYEDQFIDCIKCGKPNGLLVINSWGWDWRIKYRLTTKLT
jgi:hypothetical protein